MSCPPFLATVIGVVIYNYTSAGYTTYACARSTVVCITILVPVLLYRGVSVILRHKMGKKTMSTEIRSDCDSRVMASGHPSARLNIRVRRSVIGETKTIRWGMR